MPEVHCKKTWLKNINEKICLLNSINYKSFILLLASFISKRIAIIISFSLRLIQKVKRHEVASMRIQRIGCLKR